MLTVIGCGNANRRDDAIGVRVVQRLRDRLARHPVPGVQAFDCGTAGMEVMFATAESTSVILVDASSTGSEPGTMFEVPGTELARRREPSLSLHDFRWDDALGAGCKIYGDDFADKVTVFLIEAADTGFGLEVSDAVTAAGDRVYERILEAIAAHAVARHADLSEWTVVVDRGWLQVPVDLYQRVFDDREGVVPFALDEALCFMPVRQVEGGLLAKVKNACGDRSIDASEFLRANGWDDWGRYECRASWESSLGALSIVRQDARSA